MTIAFRPRADQEERLEALAKRTGRTKSFYVAEALDAHLDDLEERYWAHDVVRQWEESDQKTRPLADIKAELDL
ncbi:MAG: TraY domain-containing protein [Salinibacterium sp.]|nr:TraY domain-containing protein [Micrococcales bacterium]MBX3078617.1 TraY domain-containing protein [Cryobacterium sp.]MCB1280176.1 TraY domain-containing protein [Salinibacterium sp.]HNP15070.1 TraY domain-containing protein [Terrimesophilobacter sp.]